MLAYSLVFANSHSCLLSFAHGTSCQFHVHFTVPPKHVYLKLPFIFFAYYKDIFFPRGKSWPLQLYLLNFVAIMPVYYKRMPTGKNHTVLLSAY